ncbi:MAG: hypothetical protein JRM93_04770 [Nitrososphaerota archaeon]|jgi:hypothetical protein|nr:MAG: hypothetical protein JRM93_04770 [Nitrososphaerota archaeon]
MFTSIRDGAFSWSTTDPADDWVMVGHLFVRKTGVVFVDPPLVPGLIDAAAKFGKPEAVLLTTQNHTRAAAFLRKRAGIPAYLPEQDPNSVDPREAVKVKGIGDFEIYRAGSVLGFRAYKSGSEHVLLTEEKELLTGDIAAGDRKGNLLLWPDWYTQGPPYDAYSKELKDSERKEIKEAFKALVKRTRAGSLLASHGHDIIGNLQARASKL